MIILRFFFKKKSFFWKKNCECIKIMCTFAKYNSSQKVSMIAKRLKDLKNRMV